MRVRLWAIGWVALLASACCCANVARSQEIHLGDDVSSVGAARRQHVEVLTDAVQVRASRPEWVEVRFRVDPGFHINSHAPHDELLVPTALDLTGAEQMKLLRVDYPEGVPLRLDVGGGETLSTYQGEFRVRLQLLILKGDATLVGALKYQACDARSCFPPKSLPVRISVSARE